MDPSEQEPATAFDRSGGFGGLDVEPVVGADECLRGESPTERALSVGTASGRIGRGCNRMFSVLL